MRYIEQILQPGERLMHTAKLHGIIFVPGAVLLLVGLFLLGWLAGTPSAGSIGKLSTEALCALLAAIGAVWVGAAWLKRFSTEIDVTDRRGVYKRGLFRRHTVEMNMDKVESVDVDQTILGRLLDYGDVTVRGTGVSMEQVTTVRSPLAFRNHVTAR